jgi:hypothetical protein
MRLISRVLLATILVADLLLVLEIARHYMLKWI